MNEAEILAQASRPGWRVTGRKPEVEKRQVSDAVGNVTSQDVPTGNLVWTIASPDGKQVDSIVVSPSTAQSSNGFESPGYALVEGPTRNLPADAATSRPPTPAGKLEIVNDPRTGRPIKLRDPSTGTVIDLPDTPAGSRPSIVQGPKDSVYAWDGQNLTPLLPPSPDKPDKPQIIQGQRGALYSWDGSSLNQVKPGDAPERQVAVVDNQLIDKNTGQVIYTAPQGVKFQTSQDGTILAIDPANPSNVHVIWSPKRPPELVPGQNVNQQQILQRDPNTGELMAVPNPIAGQAQPTNVTGQTGPYILQQMPDGSFRRVPNPAYVPAFQQALQEHLDSIGQLEQQVANGQMTIADADRYKQLLGQRLDAQLQGTTPYQIEQDRQTRAAQRTATARDLLNQRVSSGTNLASSLLNGAINIVSNPHFMDPSALAGFSPFSGAFGYVTDLGGGPGVYDAASQAVQAGLKAGADPATSLLSAALGPAPQAQPQQADQTLPAVASQLPGEQLPQPSYNYTPETSAQSQARNQGALAGQLGAGVGAALGARAQYGQPNVAPTAVPAPMGLDPAAWLLSSALGRA